MNDYKPSEQRSRIMRTVRSKNTSPEMAVRRLLYSSGYRYRLHSKDLPGKPDIIFRSRKKAIFVHGCFWHGHSCKRGARMPKTNQEYWQGKISRNVERDKTHVKQLTVLGWDVLIIWECETKDLQKLKDELTKFLN